MINRIKMSVVILGIIFSSQAIAQDQKDPEELKINSKLIKLDVKKKCRTRKIKGEQGSISYSGDKKPLRGFDFAKDDKKDSVTVTVDIQNKNACSLEKCKLITVIYSKSVTEKRAAPEIYKEFSEDINELKSKGKYQKEFSCEMIYDKSEDRVDGLKDSDIKNPNAENIAGITRAFGSSFYGYKVDIVNAEGKVILTKTWPSGLMKVLEAAKKK